MTERRVLVHAPRGRDAEVVQSVLAGRNIAVHICLSQQQLLDALNEGAAAAIVTEEAFSVSPDSPLDRWLTQQPSWSDFPFIVLATRQTTRRTGSARASLHALGNVVLLERPVNAETLASAADAAVRARNRQYATRQHLEELDETRATVEKLNRELEDRIEARTRELAGANDRLMTEISERGRAQAALVHAQKMEAIGRLTGGIAHDFNNLLHVVSMNLDLLGRLALDSKPAALAARARRAVDRGSKLTGQLLSFARAQPLRPRLVDVNALLFGMQELVAISVGSSVQLKLALNGEQAWAQIDANQLEMAVLNLAVNAKDAMNGVGTLTLSVALREDLGDDLPPGTYVVVSVADEGRGIPASLLPKVFDPFFTTKPVGSGTGLGLSQVYGFAQQSGGVARIESEIDRGTVVEICFPAADAGSASTHAPIDTTVDSVGYRRILVVEDDADVRRVIVDSLSFAGHTVTSAADGPTGLAALERTAPDLLIVDYAMRGMNGAEVIKHAREIFPDLPVILATGYADMVEVGRVLGAKSILVKPFDVETLLQAVVMATHQTTH
ncbi:response regulator [Pigmentiphaga aceris]|uniref:response regulator n=1 Tax=Pigmentiphaga aceris TaxID=1940612 RepID=UPI001FEB0C2B|nr:response regulator [Pigmentiphaga aceris]